MVVDGGQCSDSIGRDGVGFLTQRTGWSYIILNGAEEQKRCDSCKIFLSVFPFSKIYKHI